jgi:hypothetical protein
MPAFYKYFMYTKNMKQILFLTMKNCFRYLKLMSPLNEAICTTISYTLWMILYKKQLFDLEVKGQGPTKVIMVRDTLPYGYAPTYQLSLIYLERQKCYGPDKKILFKKQLLTLRSKVKVPQRSLRYTTHHLMVMHIRTICQWTVLLDLFELFDLEVKGHCGTRHTPLWSCTHILIIDLSQKTKM